MRYSDELIEVGNRFIAWRKERMPFTPDQRDLMKRSLVRQSDRPPSCVFVDSTELRETLGINFGEDRRW